MIHFKFIKCFIINGDNKSNGAVMKRSKIILVLVILFAVFATGCGNNDKEEAAARVVMDRYFRAIKKLDYNRAFSNYSPTIYRNTDFNEWFKSYKKAHASLGRVVEYELIESTFTRKEGGEPGILITHTYNTRYTIKKTTEKFSIFKLEGESEYMIIRHNIAPATM